MTIAQRIHRLRQSLPDNIRLIAVTKQVSLDAMREAYTIGIRDFGENRLQEALAKQEQLSDLTDVCWHFIGHLQTNKAQKVLDHFQWIHSVDSLKLAQRLDFLASDMAHSPQICLQVKILKDPNKYGWEVNELIADLPKLETCCHLKIRGLMSILPLGLSESESLAAFESVRDLSQTLTGHSHLSLVELSMGMSDDYLLAVRAGATMIRLGRIIFGERR